MPALSIQCTKHIWSTHCLSGPEGRGTLSLNTQELRDPLTQEGEQPLSFSIETRDTRQLGSWPHIDASLERVGYGEGRAQPREIKTARKINPKGSI